VNKACIEPLMSLHLLFESFLLSRHKFVSTF